MTKSIRSRKRPRNSYMFWSNTATKLKISFVIQDLNRVKFQRQYQILRDLGGYASSPLVRRQSLYHPLL